MGYDVIIVGGLVAEGLVAIYKVVVDGILTILCTEIKAIV